MMLLIVLVLGGGVPVSEAFIASYGLCQAACAAGVVVCYTSAGHRFSDNLLVYYSQMVFNTITQARFYVGAGGGQLLPLP